MSFSFLLQKRINASSQVPWTTYTYKIHSKMGSTWSWPWSPSNSITSKNKNIKSEAMLQFEQQVEMMDAVFKRYFKRL